MSRRSGDRKVRLAVVVAIIICSLAGCKQKPSSAHERDGTFAGGGRTVGRSYVNDRLGISYAIPDGYSTNLCCSFLFTPGDEMLLVAAKRASHTPLSNSLRLDARDERLRDSKTCKEQNAVWSEMTVQPEIVLAGKDRDVQLGSMSYRRVDLRNKNGQQTTYLCTEMRGFWLRWTIDSESQKELDTVIESIAKMEMLPRKSS